MVRVLKIVGQTQQFASKTYNDMKGNSQTILPIGGIRKKYKTSNTTSKHTSINVFCNTQGEDVMMYEHTHCQHCIHPPLFVIISVIVRRKIIENPLNSLIFTLLCALSKLLWAPMGTFFP